MAKPKHKLTPAERRLRRERKKKNFMTIFINGRQKRVPRPKLLGGLPADEFVARNADPIWLHQNAMWEHMTRVPVTEFVTDQDIRVQPRKPL